MAVAIIALIPVLAIYPFIQKELIKGITGFKFISVCEDETEAYEYWKNHFNPNPDDCCNLRTVE